MIAFAMLLVLGAGFVVTFVSATEYAVKKMAGELPARRPHRG